MITVIYPYRNRDMQRVQRSLDSLQAQSETGFEVVFVNYGSSGLVNANLEELLRGYPFVKYIKHPAQHQLWSKCTALNSIVRSLKEGHCFIADIDMIFSPHFMSTVKTLADASKIHYFQVGFLGQNEPGGQKQFSSYKIRFKSEAGATGLSLFPVKALHEVGGFDEFFHFWGSEDTDLHNRLKLAGYDVVFYDKELLMLHQWHPTYRSQEENRLTVLPRLSNAVRLNQAHLNFNLAKKIIRPNAGNWGKTVREEDAKSLEDCQEMMQLSNRKEVVDHFLFVELPKVGKGVLSVRFSEDPFQHTAKYRLKKWLGKSVPEYYTLKEINDALLLHIISFYRDFPYYYKVSDDLKSIGFKILKDF